MPGSHTLLRRRLTVAAIIGVGLLCLMPWAMAQEPKTGGTLRFIPHADLKVLDPVWTTAYITRNHGYMVYDVLFALDEHLKIQPQMVDSW
jgi:peptide/nickel transport system substrate-binding protein